MLIPHRLLRIAGAMFLACLIAQAVLGWVLGVTEAWVTVTIVAALLSVLAIVDARSGDPSEAADERYDPVVCAVAGIAVVAAVGCLYLPLPWGGLAGAAVVTGLVIALRLSHGRS